jgi:proteic killer suppression protein
MNLEFADEDLRRLFEDPDFVVPRFGPDVIKAYRKKVGFLVAATSELDLRAYKALRFEKLLGDRAGQHSIRLNDQWRLILQLDRDSQGKLLVLIEIVDYH